MRSLAACGIGFLLDLLFGDPRWLYHPVCLIGNWIAFFEKRLRASLERLGRSQDRKCLVAAGGVLWIVTVLLGWGVPFLCLFAAYRLNSLLGFALEVFWCWQIPASRCLAAESGKVWRALKQEGLDEARRAVSMIVGRDTENLTEEGVIKAAVETVAENTSDGVTAPLLYLMLGGPALGFLYKAVNTMDSMVGYQNDRYLYFGRIPAKMDDVFNYVPSRLTALVMIVAAFILGMDGKNGWAIYRRDRRKHASPNSAQTEAVCAGVLRVQLAGDAVYFGKVKKKDYIGDPLRPVEPEDIIRAGRLMYATSILTFLLLGGGKLALLLLFRI